MLVGVQDDDKSVNSSANLQQTPIDQTTGLSKLIQCVIVFCSNLISMIFQISFATFPIALVSNCSCHRP